MALDISVYQRLTPAAADDDRDKVIAIRANPEFPAHAAGIVDGAYTAADWMQWRVGSYGNYNEWREALARMAGYPAAPDPETGRPSHARAVWRDGLTGPFAELINFSDCDGIIGPLVSAKLARDFTEHAARAAASPDAWFVLTYRRFMAAFQMAADGGAVEFH